MTKVGQLFIDEMEQKLSEKEREVTVRVNEDNRETVRKNLRAMHADWSEERIAEEAALLFA